MPSSLISCYNEALALIASGDIADIDEVSIEARECNRFGPALLDEIGEWADWPFKTARAVLAVVDNNRPAEWLYCYAVPADMAEPLALRHTEDAATNLPEFGPYPFPYQDAVTIPFKVEGDRIYANVETALLVYVRSSFNVGDLGPLTRRAYIDELAARIALPIKKDARLAQAMAQRAMYSKGEAIANERNRRPQQAQRYVSEAEFARAGFVQ
jgi:hypothetical protein